MSIKIAVPKLQHSLLCWDFCLLVLDEFSPSWPRTAPLPHPSRAPTTFPVPRRKTQISSARLLDLGLFTYYMAAVLTVFAFMITKVRNQPNPKDYFRGPVAKQFLKFTKTSKMTIVLTMTAVPYFVLIICQAGAEHFPNIIIHSPSCPGM